MTNQVNLWQKETDIEKRRRNQRRQNNNKKTSEYKMLLKESGV